MFVLWTENLGGIISHIPTFETKLVIWWSWSHQQPDKSWESLKELLCVVQFVVVRQTSCFNQLEIHTCWLNGVNQVQKWNTATDVFVLSDATCDQKTAHVCVTACTHTRVKAHLKAFDRRSLSSRGQSLIDPWHNQIFSCNLSISKVLQNI